MSKTYRTHFVKGNVEVLGSHKLTTRDHSKMVASRDVLLNISSMTWSNHHLNCIIQHHSSWKLVMQATKGKVINYAIFCDGKCHEMNCSIGGL